MLQNNTTNKKDLQVWAFKFLEEKEESVSYLKKFGSPFERALMETVEELAEGELTNG
ncbi:hypothetical protein [Methanosalsum natronophilum]|uniref:hypothetical protein n=1 Tax=Methanosalsum natronophilum TaxID=768733 RepID=UPI002168064E|nr:hypothetical protein [Methanosalsum natronophilum]MCS3924110.1 hypothetical protein [Methanosalsum natronophilum]